LSSNVAPLPALGGAIASAVIGALFAGADIAITSLSASRLEALVDQSEGPRKQAYERIQRQDAKLRSRYLLGRVASTAVTAVCFLELFEGYLPSAGAAFWIALGTTIGVTSVLFEISTSLARKYADSAAALAAIWLRPLEIALLPLAIPLGWLGENLSRKDPEQPIDPRVTEAEVEALVDEGERSGLFGREPAEMIRNVLDFAERTAKDVMIPRSRVEAIELSTPIDRALRMVAESGHSRYPVYKEQIDNIVGLLYAKDLFQAVQIEESAEPKVGVKSLAELLRTTANFVAESQPLSTLLKEMKARRQHLAIVVDEFGSVSGIVTLEDVLEEIVGDIQDEHDTAAIEDLGDGRVMADAAISVKELFDYLGIGSDGAASGPMPRAASGGAEIPDTPAPEESDQPIGEMLTRRLGKIPEVGTAFSKFGLRFIVRASDDKHVDKVEVIRA
jgi:CBS domain containing-hemolysin-like protein